MQKPVILVIGADPDEVAALRHGLSARYGERFRVMSAHSGHAASDLADHLIDVGTHVALIVFGHDALSLGLDSFLATAHASLADSRRAMVARFGKDKEALALLERSLASCTIQAPWSDFDAIAPQIDDLLADWEASSGADAVVAVIGHRWASHSHDLKDFLGRNEVPFRWVDLDRGFEAVELLESLNRSDAALPVVVVSSDVVLEDPTVAELAESLGMHVHAEGAYYDLAIVGGGPAGLAAAVYGASEGLSTILVERQAPGGQAGTSSRIENYLGFPNGVSGADLAHRALTQATRLGAEIVTPVEVRGAEMSGRYKRLSLSDGTEITAQALIVATGVTYRSLDAPGLRELAGAGVYYGAATTEAATAAGEHVYVIGSANSAGQGAVYFARFADRVTVIARGESLRVHMSEYLVEQIERTPNIEVLNLTHVVHAHGGDHLEELTFEHVETGNRTRVPASFLFIFVGAAPEHPWLPSSVAQDDHGYLLTGRDVEASDTNWNLARPPMHLETSVPGVFAVGDVRHGSIRRVAGAVGEGSTAVQLVHRYLAE